MEKLSLKMLENIQGGQLVSRKEYCQTLGTIMANNDLSDGAKAGAQYGWNKYCA